MVLPFPAESVRQTSEAPNLHPHREVLPLDMRRANLVRVGASDDWDHHRGDNFRGREGESTRVWFCCSVVTCHSSLLLKYPPHGSREDVVLCRLWNRARIEHLVVAGQRQVKFL